MKKVALKHIFSDFLKRHFIIFLLLFFFIDFQELFLTFLDFLGKDLIFFLKILELAHFYCVFYVFEKY